MVTFQALPGTGEGHAGSLGSVDSGINLYIFLFGGQFANLFFYQLDLGEGETSPRLGLVN